MATATTPPALTPEEFRKQFENSDRAYEYWFGEAIEKPVPTWLHAIVQVLVAEAFRRAGYRAGTELDLRIDLEFQPRPDISATRQPLTGPYPTSPEDIEIVVEVLSPDDKQTRVYQKCIQYQRLGIAQLFVIDPENRTAWQWNRDLGQLDRVMTWKLTNGQPIQIDDIWQQLDAELAK